MFRRATLSIRAGPPPARKPLLHRFIQNEDVDAGVGEDESDFGRLEEIIDGHRDGAGLPDAEEGRDKFRAIPEPDADPVAAPDAEARTRNRWATPRVWAQNWP